MCTHFFPFIFLVVTKSSATLSTAIRRYCYLCTRNPATTNQLKSVSLCAPLHLPPLAAANLYAQAPFCLHILKPLSNFRSFLDKQPAHLLLYSLQPMHVQHVNHISWFALISISPLPAKVLYEHSPLFSYIMDSAAHFCSYIRTP